MSETKIKSNFAEKLGQGYLNYAMSVIVDRALPDVRDGLKPVHRRILFGMNELGLHYNKAHKKSARLVGDVLGKTHPHGDQSVYEAMVKLAQDFNMRYPLVDGQGNFGSIDGDGAAAMRYTETRLSKIGQAMLKDLYKNTVDFKPNFDESLTEPTVLPSLLPNLLLNGASGIAVGMATNMAPHNLNEIYSALDYIIECVLANKDYTVADLLKYIKGPDFPTGGTIIKKKGIEDAYNTGKGKIVIRSKYQIEEKKGKQRIIITEIPFKVNKAKLIERIDSLTKTKKDKKGKVLKEAIITTISEIRDESDKDGLRIVIEFKKNTNIQLSLNKLFKFTQLQDSFNINAVALVNGEPKNLNLKELLDNFLSHSANVILRRTQFDLNKAEKRNHIIEGIIKSLKNIDEVIKIIKKAESKTDAINNLNNDYGLSLEQAKAVVEMKLSSLTNQSIEKLTNEKKELEKDILKWNSILNDQFILLKTMQAEFKEIKANFGDDRRTQFEFSVNSDFLIKNEKLIITLTNNNEIKSVEENTYKTQHRGGRGVKSIQNDENKIIKSLLTVNAKDDLLFFTSTGRCHTIKAYKIDKSSRIAKSKSIMNYLNLESDEKVINMLSTNLQSTINDLLLVTKNGLIKKISLSKLSTRMSITKVITFVDDDELVSSKIIKDDTEVIIITSAGKGIRIETAKIRPTGRTARGVIAIKLKNKKDYVVDMVIVNNDSTLFTICKQGVGKKTPFNKYSIKNRGGLGITCHVVSEKTGVVIGALAIEDNDDLIIATKKGLMIKIKAKDISTQGRAAKGVKIIELEEGDNVVAISQTKTISKNQKKEII